MITETIREQLAKSVKYVKPIPYHAATGLTAQVYQQLEADFLPAPLVILHAAVPEIMAGVWSMLRETLLAGKIDRSHKEAVAATVSKTNECPFCIDAHTLMLRATSDHDVANAILRGDYDSIHDPQLRALVQWVLANRIANNSGARIPFSRHDAPEMIGTAVAFHYLNRIANIFLGDTLLPLPSVMKGVTYRVYAATAGKRIVRPLQQGNSLQFIPPERLPDDLFWADENPAVAGAFAGLAKAVDEAGERVLPDPVRQLTRESIYAWKGETMSMSRRWVEDLVVEIPEKDRAAARLTLLTALASYQVDAGIIEAFQRQYPDDDQLIAATGWASFTAARRVGVWLVEPSWMAL